MKVLLKIIRLVVTIISLTACPNESPNDRGFRFFNNSEFNVCTYIGGIDRKYGGVLYPDTALMNTNVMSGSTMKGESFFYSFNSNGVDTMSLYIIDADTLKKYSWEEIRTGYKILQRYDLDVSVAALRKLDLKVTYPPTEAMKDVKMYPPYKK